MNSSEKTRKKSYWKSNKKSDNKSNNRHPTFIPKADKKLKKVFSEIGVPKNTEFIPDDFQIEAINKIMEHDILVSAPTGSGKTYIAVEAMKKVFASGKRSWYASPLKALSNSKYHEFEEEFGKENVGVITGDRKENTDASIVVGTTEILRNQLYDSMAKGSDFEADLVILDEAHYLGDSDRGVVWEEVMIYLPKRVRLLMLSATIPNGTEIASWLSRIRQHPCHVVQTDKRPVPIFPLYLLPDGEIVPLSGFDGITTKIKNFLRDSQHQRNRRSQFPLSYSDILQVLSKYNLLPAVFFLKSRMDCNNALLACQDWFITKTRSTMIQKRLDTFIEQYPFLKNHSQIPFIASHGLGSHHGGQLPHWKIVIEKLMSEGLLDAMFSTSTVAAGVNFPARTVLLVQSDRFNGKEFVTLTPTDLHQATGRAGRRGKDKIGFAVMVHGPFQDPHIIDELLAQPPDPIESQIKINFSMSLNLLLSHNPEEIHDLLNVSFATHQTLDEVQELQKQKERTLNILQTMTPGAKCNTISEIHSRRAKRDVSYKRIARLKKKRKKFIKDCYRAAQNPHDDERYLELTKKIDELSDDFKKQICEGCPVSSQCCDRKTRFVQLVNKAKTLSDSLDEVQNSQWNDFSRHLQFLKLNFFADHNGNLTEDGIWASKLRLDQPLIIAELIRKGSLNNLSHELLTSIIAVFVNDKVRDIDSDDSDSEKQKLLRKTFFNITKTLEDLISLKKKYGFDVPQLQFWPAAAIHSWACGETWEEVIRLTSVDEGDLAMLIFRTADNLRQITSLATTHPELAEKAKESIHHILREPVIIPT